MQVESEIVNEKIRAVIALQRAMYRGRTILDDLSDEGWIKTLIAWALYRNKSMFVESLLTNLPERVADTIRDYGLSFRVLAPGDVSLSGKVATEFKIDWWEWDRKIPDDKKYPVPPDLLKTFFKELETFLLTY